MSIKVCVPFRNRPAEQDALNGGWPSESGAKGGGEPVDVIVGGVQVGGQAQGRASDAGGHASVVKNVQETGAGATGNRQSEHMGASGLAGRGGKPKAGGAVGDLVGDGLQGVRNVGHIPGEQLVDRGDGHRDEAEVGALTDVVAAGAGQVLIGVVDQRGEVLRAVPQDPVLLEWPAVKVLAGNVEVADAERAQQPLVADSNDEVLAARTRDRFASRRGTGWRR